MRPLCFAARAGRWLVLVPRGPAAQLLQRRRPGRDHAARPRDPGRRPLRLLRRADLAARRSTSARGDERRAARRLPACASSTSRSRRSATPRRPSSRRSSTAAAAPAGKLGDLTDAELGDATIGRARRAAAEAEPAGPERRRRDARDARPAEIPYEALDLDGSSDEAEYRDTRPRHLHRDASASTAARPSSVERDLHRARRRAAGARRRDRSARRRRPRATSATASRPRAPRRPVRRSTSRPAAHGADRPAHATELELRRRARLDARPDRRARAHDPRAAAARSDSNEVTTTVDDSRDPGDELAERAADRRQDALLTGHIASATDIDSFTFTPGAGRTTISLSHLPGRLRPGRLRPDDRSGADAMRRTAMRRTAMRRTPVERLPPRSPTDETIARARPDPGHRDAPHRRCADRRARTLDPARARPTRRRASSSRPTEAGETFVAQVVGYNGSADAEPYVIRRTDAPPRRRRSTARSRSLELRLLRSRIRAAIPATHRGALPGRPGAGWPRATARPRRRPRLDKLEAARRHQTDGVVVPVENNPRRPDLAPPSRAWDADPCSAERANEVVTAINEVVDDVRAEGDGPPELRSIVLVGPDEVIPQAPGRRTDRRSATSPSTRTTRRSTATATASRDDNAVSAALPQRLHAERRPVYGDFDPTRPASSPTSRSAAWSRPPRRSRRRSRPSSTADGLGRHAAARVRHRLRLPRRRGDARSSARSRARCPARQSRIDETWTAADALARPERRRRRLPLGQRPLRPLPRPAGGGLQRHEPRPAGRRARERAAPAASPSPSAATPASTSPSATPRRRPTRASATGPSRWRRTDALYAANTGFGYGDDAAVAYSERIMADYAGGLASGEVTAGQALMLAKQQALAQRRRDRRLLDQGLDGGDLLRPADVPDQAPTAARARASCRRSRERRTRHATANDAHDAQLDPVLRRPARPPQPGRERRARHLLAGRRPGAAGRPAPADPAEADRGRHVRRGPGARVPARVADDRPMQPRVRPGDRAGDDRPRRARARARVDRSVLPGDDRDGRAAGDGRGPARHPHADGRARSAATSSASTWRWAAASCARPRTTTSRRRSAASTAWSRTAASRSGSRPRATTSSAAPSST